MRLFLFILSFISLVGSLSLKTAEGQPTQKRNSYRMVFYNVENYFDTVNDPDKKDDEFTPDGFKRWNFYRYKEKQNKIAKTLIAAGQWKVPALVGLAEVENRQVLKDLLQFSPLAEFDYRILHKESPDWRGIDVALLYRANVFKPLDTSFLPVTFEDTSHSPTRDILYAKGLVANQDTLHLFVNHWPSRYGGKAETDPKRARAARILRNKVTAINTNVKQPKIIITGDFNDGPGNKSIKQVLNAKPVRDDSREGRPLLVNMMNVKSKSDQQGSYKYQYKWHTFDQFIISRYLLEAKQGLTVQKGGANIFRSDFLLKEDDDYPGLKPHRTYLGPRYKGGYSDHLPVLLDLYPAGTINQSDNKKE